MPLSQFPTLLVFLDLGLHMQTLKLAAHKNLFRVALTIRLAIASLVILATSVQAFLAQVSQLEFLLLFTLSLGTLPLSFLGALDTHFFTIEKAQWGIQAKLARMLAYSFPLVAILIFNVQTALPLLVLHTTALFVWAVFAGFWAFKKFTQNSAHHVLHFKENFQEHFQDHVQEHLIACKKFIYEWWPNAVPPLCFCVFWLASNTLLFKFSGLQNLSTYSIVSALGSPIALAMQNVNIVVSKRLSEAHVSVIRLSAICFSTFLLLGILGFAGVGVLHHFGFVQKIFPHLEASFLTLFAGRIAFEISGNTATFLSWRMQVKHSRFYLFSTLLVYAFGSPIAFFFLWKFQQHAAFWNVAALQFALVVLFALKFSSKFRKNKIGGARKNSL
jgi:hypothetical protein